MPLLTQQNAFLIITFNLQINQLESIKQCTIWHGKVILILPR